MATTSLWRITSAKGEKTLRQLIDYVENPDKTEWEKGGGREPSISEAMWGDERSGEDVLEDLMGYVGRSGATEERKLISGLGVDPEKALEQMLSVKRRWGKERGTLAYHGYQSFAEGEVSPEEAHAIGLELARNLWGDRHQVLVATHTDKANHIHNHFVINTVSFVDGKKFRRTPKDYAAMRAESDRLCREKNKSVIREPKAKGVGYREWKETRDGAASSIRSVIRRDIDLAISESASWMDFIESMEGFGYQFRLYKKDGGMLERPALRSPDGERFLRFYKLGSGYDVDHILDRILGHEEKPQLAYTQREAQLVSAYWRMNRPRNGPKTLQGLYQRYIFELTVVRKWSHIRRALPMATRAAAARLASYERQRRLLKENGIESLGELKDFREKLEDEISKAEERRGQIRGQLRRARRGQDKPETSRLLRWLKEEGEQVRRLKSQIRDADEIAYRSLAMQEEIRVIDQKWADYEAGQRRAVPGKNEQEETGFIKDPRIKPPQPERTKNHKKGKEEIL